VRDALIKDIKNRTDISQDLEKIDFIVFSGDVAYSGKPLEYESAKEELFDPVLNKCNLGPEKLFIVPGNHDLDRAKFVSLPDSLKRPLKSKTEANDWLFEGKKRSIALKPLDAFTNFVSRYTQQENPDYANIRKWEIDGKKIALIGIDSAWMCGRKNSDGEVDDRHGVVVGEPQIYDPLEEISESNIIIAVLHHPLDWLAYFEFSQIKGRLMNGGDFILCGHQHKPGIEEIHSPLGYCVVIPAGACYDSRTHANAYNFVHLDFNSGKRVAFLRCWGGITGERTSIHPKETEVNMNSAALEQLIIGHPSFAPDLT